MEGAKTVAREGDERAAKNCHAGKAGVTDSSRRKGFGTGEARRGQGEG
jgi:hypothetical protein